MTEAKVKIEAKAKIELVKQAVNKIENIVGSQNEFLVNESEDYKRGYKRATFDAMSCMVDSLPDAVKELLPDAIRRLEVGRE